jgi:uncharacterized membrane protein YgcG
MPIFQIRICTLLIVLSLLPMLVLPVQSYLIPMEWIDEIEYYALQVDQETTAEIVVVVLQSLTGHEVTDQDGNEISDIVQLGVYIFNELPLETYDGDTVVGIGKEGKDNGVLILIALEEQQWRIEVGYGLEGDITDIETNRIAQEYLVPQLSQGNFGEGLYDTLVALGQQIPVTNQTSTEVRGTYYYEQDIPTEEIPFWETDWFLYGVIALMILLGFSVGVPVFRRGGGRGRGGRSGGGGSTGRW